MMRSSFSVIKSQLKSDASPYTDSSTPTSCSSSTLHRPLSWPWGILWSLSVRIIFLPGIELFPGTEMGMMLDELASEYRNLRLGLG